MSSFEWLELQTLTQEIAEARSHLSAARSAKDRARTRALEAEIAAAEGRRDRLLANITTDLVDAAEQGQRSGAAKPALTGDAAEGAGSGQAAAAVEASAVEEPAMAEPTAAGSAVAEAVPGETEGEPQPAATEDRTVATAAASPAPTAQADSVEGGIMAWDQLTPSDLERAKRELGVRRADMLARHAEELKALETDRAELEALDQAVTAFTEKFGKAAVVKLAEERELRQQGRG